MQYVKVSNYQSKYVKYVKVELSLIERLELLSKRIWDSFYKE